MLEETDNIIGMEIYTPDGVFVGCVTDVVLNVTDGRADGLFVAEPSPVVAEPGVTLGIPFEWVSGIGDVVILDRFPGRVLRDGSVG
ncbi:MAG: photosystem reaction center subunit H [Thermoplasmatales archaeon]|nr:photosystem reaction center subunit H [Thermoplasmatales archaeon]